MAERPERWAYLSVFDKTGIIDFARGLAELGFRLAATPGTAALIASGGLEVAGTEKLSSIQPLLGGLVKSLHPMVHAGIMADRDNEGEMAECRKLGIPCFDLVAVNFPIIGGIHDKGCEPGGRVYSGGLSLLRSATSNYKQVLAVTEPRDYPRVLAALAKGGDSSLNRELAQIAISMVAEIDCLAAAALEGAPQALPPVMRNVSHKVMDLRYGENPHQQAALYVSKNAVEPCLALARQLTGPAPSYNNMLDADVGILLAMELAAPGAVIIKHAMPVSAAVGGSLAEAADKAFAAEYASRVGAAVACNRVVNAAAAQAIIKGGQAINLVIAPDFEPEAKTVFESAASENLNLRLLRTGTRKAPAGVAATRRIAFRNVGGGFLAQSPDESLYGAGGFHIGTTHMPEDRELVDLEFAYLVAKYTRTQAVILANNGATVAVASVATDQEMAVRVALSRAEANAVGVVAALDSAIELPQLDRLASAGVRAIIHTGHGNGRDKELFDFCDSRGVALIVSRMRHFRH